MGPAALLDSFLHAFRGIRWLRLLGLDLLADSFQFRLKRIQTAGQQGVCEVFPNLPDDLRSDKLQGQMLVELAGRLPNGGKGAGWLSARARDKERPGQRKASSFGLTGNYRCQL